VVTIVLDGRTTELIVPPDGRSILDAALTARPDAPYACKGGVCGTCRCRLVEGEVKMAHRYALEDDELAAGVRLACQARPLSQRVVLDFDAV
jgi:ring-1,2-phenylacetyl-CoA epoxidase subunit PaaE